MPSGSAWDQWPELHAEHLAWAHDGRRAFVEGLRDPEARRLYEHQLGGRPVVVTAGFSQVGKTSVVLALLGVAQGEPEAETVEKVLRGGRSKGLSASATAAEYEVSEDDSWSIRAGGVDVQTEDPEVACRAIEDVRTVMEDRPDLLGA